MGARVYLSALGRFLQVDPVEGGTDNNYAYVNDPVNLFDITGLSKNRAQSGRGYQNPSRQQWDAYNRKNAGLKYNSSDYKAWTKTRNSNQKWQAERNRQKRNRNDNDKNNPTAPPNIPSNPYIGSRSGGNNGVAKAVVGGGAAIGAGVVLWWVLKLASPVCGPAAPACAVVF